MPIATAELTHGPSAVHYHRTGHGPGVVLIHGTFGNAQPYWTPVIEQLAHRYTVVAVDLAGSGDTTHPATVTLEDLAAQAAGAAAHAGLTRYHLAGHSLGAVTAAAVAARHPDRTLSLLLHAPWPVTDARGRFQFRWWEQLLAADPAALARLLQLTAVLPDATADADDTEIASSIKGFEAMVDTRHAVQLRVDQEVDIRHLLPLITAPTLVLVSNHDQIIPPAAQRAVAAAITRARYRDVDAGHAYPFENSAEFVGNIVDFVHAHSGPGPS